MLFVMLLVLLSTPAIGREIEQPPFVTIGGRVIHDIRYNELKKVIDPARIFEGCFRYPNDGTIEARDFFMKDVQVTDYFEPLQWEENSDCPRDGWVRFIYTAKENLRDIRKEDVAAECPSPKTMQVEKIVTVEAPPRHAGGAELEMEHVPVPRVRPKTPGPQLPRAGELKIAPDQSNGSSTEAVGR